MTLIEALVVVAISVLVSMIAFPSLDRTSHALAATNARVLLVSDLRTARAEAQRTGVPVAIRPLAGGYRAGDTQRTLPQDVHLSARGGALTFQPDGSAEGPAFTLVGPGIRASIAVDPVTGAVSILPARP